MFSISLLIVTAAIVYMVEAYINTYYAIEYMHGTSLFFVLLAKYGTPVLFLLLCAYIAYHKIAKKREAQNKTAVEQSANKEEQYADRIKTAVKPKACFQSKQTRYYTKFAASVQKWLPHTA